MTISLSMLGRAFVTGATCLSLAACGSIGGSGTTATTVGSDALNGLDPSTIGKTLLEADAGRLAKQATFGATPALIDHMVTIGTNAWLDEQFAAAGSTYNNLFPAMLSASCSGNSTCYNANFGRQSVAMHFYVDALSQPDQLRQRVAFALSQLFVTSASSGWPASGTATINQIFLDNAFGNYRALLAAVTLNPNMGVFLNVANSNRLAPNENYAREMLQLFSMGPNKLNNDGSFLTDSSGNPQPNYTPDDIKGIARALTGWVPVFLSDNINYDLSKPMVTRSAWYDTTAKTFLGTTVPAGASQQDSVNATINAAFNNASTPPFIAKFLIQQLVTSNPSPAYIGRIAAVFINNGSNVRGDLKAVVRAILVDSEARIPPIGNNIGKVKEPILLMTSIARALGITSDGYPMASRDTVIGQPVFAAPSVFNYYPPDNPLPQSATLVSPSSKLLTAANIVQRNNLIYDWTIGTVVARGEFAPVSYVAGSTGTAVDWSPWEAFGTNTAALVDRIDLLMTNRTMTTAQKTALTAAANAITNGNVNTQARLRAATLLYIVGTSPLFQVDR